ncbi:MAG TPA: hypothetical protein PLO65_05750 [Caulobacter sp.]|nr:hypothetical protein [Caulobacter sp.]
MDHDDYHATAPAAAPAMTDALAAWEKPLLRRLDAGDAEAIVIGVGVDLGV